jgi:hypothetical protein
MTNSPISFFVQGLVAVIIIGGFYSLYASTKAYGGLIGQAIRFLGVGMMFIVVAVIEKILINFAIIDVTITVSIVQDLFNLLGILFLGIGFSKLASASKV